MKSLFCVYHIGVSLLRLTISASIFIYTNRSDLLSTSVVQMSGQPTNCYWRVMAVSVLLQKLNSGYIACLGVIATFDSGDDTGPAR